VAVVSLSLAVLFCLPSAAAGQATPPDAAKLLARSLAVMRQTVRSVHTSAVSRSSTGTAAVQTEGQQLYTAASCTVSGQGIAVRVGQHSAAGPTNQLIMLLRLGRPARVWQRSGTGRLIPWTRMSPLSAGFISAYCPGSPIFLSICTARVTASVCTHWAARPLPYLRDLGTEQWGGFTIWHLQSISVSSTCCFGSAKSPGSFTDIEDFYIDQASLRIVHQAQRIHTEAADGSFVGDEETTYTYSRFNAPVTITRPRNVAPHNP
jgi:hypothetical protein